MADLKETADQFAKDLVAQNIAGLMMAFTPNGMGKAMAMQGQMAAAGPQAPTTGHEVNIIGPDGDDTVIDIVMKNAGGQGIIMTKWKEVAGAWKVDDMSLRA